MKKKKSSDKGAKKHDAHCETSSIEINRRKQTSPVEYQHRLKLTNNSSVS